MLQGNIFRFVCGLLKSIELELDKSIAFLNLENDLFKEYFLQKIKPKEKKYSKLVILDYFLQINVLKQYRYMNKKKYNVKIYLSIFFLILLELRTKRNMKFYPIT